MKLSFKIAGFAAATAMMVAAPATAQVNSISDLLNDVRNNAAQVEQQNREREARFRAERDQQAALLSQARGELGALERRAAGVQGRFNENRSRIEALESELDEAQGEFRDVFGLARSKSGEFKALLDNSLITSQYPQRTAILGKVANSKALPTADELNAIYEVMLQEIRAQRQVATYTAPVANVNDGAPQEVTRVGPFTVFTADSGNFLDYIPPTGDADEGDNIFLANLPSQPKDSAILNAADAVTNASPGNVVYAPIDPTRGSLLRSFDQVPDTRERVDQGGIIGKIIIGLLIIGVLFGLFNIVRLFLISQSVKGQKRKAQASKSNPLGRIMMAYDESRNKDAETVELKMDEAILRESPKLELGLNFLKLAAGIAPLLGLLGTVTGMIQTFQAMMIYGTGDPQLMAGGISEALVTTMLGLIAAIPLLILHSFCASIARNIQATLEEQSAGIVARHVEGAVVGGGVGGLDSPVV